MLRHRGSGRTLDFMSINKTTCLFDRWVPNIGITTWGAENPWLIRKRENGTGSRPMTCTLISGKGVNQRPVKRRMGTI